MLSPPLEPELISPPADAPQMRDVGAQTVTVIEPPHGWQWLNLRELWQYRELLYFFTWRDIKVRYKQTAIGAAWAILQPTFMMIIFSLVLGRMAADHSLTVPYPVFVFAGLLPWNLFATALGGAALSLVESERLITKIYFPRLLVPVAAAGPALVDFCCASAVLGVLMLWYGIVPAWTTIFAPLALLAMLAVVTGVGSLLSALNVAYRDFRYTTTFMLQAWMFGTPAIYVASFAEPFSIDKLQSNWTSPATWFVIANPLNGCLAFFRAAILGFPLPWFMLATSGLLGILLLTLGLFYFRRVEDSFADII
jgi:lipopolysaccharide transport system permease protein